MLDTFHQILKEKKLTPVYQPIVDLRSGDIVGYEGLVRGPQDSEFFVPVLLFHTARRLGRLKELEELCCRLHVQGFVQQGLQGKLFINSSPDVVLMLFSSVDQGEHAIDRYDYLAGLHPERIVMELTESECADNYHDLNRAIADMRESGLQFAIDDLGEGYSSLRLWSEIQPEYVKVDKYFVRNIDTDALKQQLVRSICDIAAYARSTVIAEGIETVAELQVLQQLGVSCGQGYLLARPAVQTVHRMSDEVLALFGNSQLTTRVMSPARLKPSMTARQLLRQAPTVDHRVPTNQVYDLFQKQPDLQVAVVLQSGAPIGILRRGQLFDQLARLYHRELYGNKPCSIFIAERALIIDVNTKLLELGDIVTQGPRHYMADGFIITEHGAYQGVGSSTELMREITAMQMQSARYANPLTQLPGNVPITEHLDDLLKQGRSCAVCYVDLDNFKPYNDLYGYRKGDEVLRAMAVLLQRQACADSDFVGHVGGDDFIIIFSSLNWRERCQAMLAELPRILQHLYIDEHIQAGGYMAENRQGVPVFHPLITLSLGVVEIDRPELYTSSLIADLASAAKAQAKKMTGNSLFVEQRRPTTPVRQRLATHSASSPS